MLFSDYSSPAGHFRRQLLMLRAYLVFFAAWLTLDRLLADHPYFTILLSAFFACLWFVPPAPEVWTRRLIWAIGPPCALLVVELLGNTNPFASLSPMQCVLNLIWYYLFFGLLLLALGSIRFSAALAMVFSFAIGLANHYVLAFRGRIIFPSDLIALRTAFNVAGAFDYTPNETILRAALFALTYLLMLRRLRRQKRVHRPRAGTVLALCAAASLYCMLFFGTDMLPALGIYAQQWKTQENGFVLNFTAALRYSIITPPAGYSPEAVREIIADVPPGDTPSGQRPVHMLSIMNESFADLAAYDNLSLSEDPIPFLRSLKENTIKGTMYSPVTGGGTANVEFEFLTGNPLAFLPPSTVAYQLYLRENTPSLVSQCRALGYDTVSFHPYHASGWNRPLVYDWMGFDVQLYEEDVPDAERIRGFVSDKANYEKLYALTDEAGDQPLFVFNVTMQNHSGYQLPWTGLARTSTLSGELEAGFPAADQFFSLMRTSDDALRELIAHYEKSDVPTMIIFFGDHQPPLGNDFYEKLAGKPLDDRTTAEVLDQHSTPFFIWANYAIPEAEDVQISAWGLHLLAARAANLPLTGYQAFLAQMMQAVPVITPAGSITANGNFADEACIGLGAAEQALVAQYRLLAHNNLFGKENREDGFFFPR